MPAEGGSCGGAPGNEPAYPRPGAAPHKEPTLVMEAGRQTAAQWRESCGLSLPAVLLKIGPDLFNAIEFLHTKVGLIRCDLKLSNF
jgi:hypothetical protein